MSALQRSAIVVLGLLVASGCARTSNLAKTSGDALGPLAGIHNVTWPPDTPHKPADAPACILDGTDIEPKGYVFFEPGTTEPVGYGGELGACIREPAIPSEYNRVEGLRCNHLRETTFELHSFADPGQLGGETSAESLSRRRMTLIRGRLGKTAVPNAVKRTEVHDHPMDQEQGPAASATVGVRFSPARCRAVESDAPGEPNNLQLGRLPKAPRGPMTWLHAHEPTLPEWEGWEDLEPGYLNGRYLVYRRGPSDGPRRVIAIGERRAVCQGQAISFADVLGQGSILFMPGTATPIAYTGVGKCLTERPISSSDAKDLYCNFSRDAAVYLSGHAVEQPEGSGMDASELSRRRLDVVSRFVPKTAVPKDLNVERVMGSQVVGEDDKVEGPVLGVRIQVVDAPSLSEVGSRLFRQTTGPAWSESEHLQFSNFMKTWVDPPGSSIETETDIHIRYQDAYGFVQTYLGLQPSKTVEGLRALEDWVDAMFKHGCNTDEVGLPSRFLPEGATPPQSTIDLPNSSASSSEMSSSSSWETGTSRPR